MGADLVLALRRSKEHLPLLATNIAITLTQIFLLLKVQTVKPQVLVIDGVSY
jgi:hypothetical protein